MKKTLIALAVLLTFLAGNAFGYSFTIKDDWVSFKGFESTKSAFPKDEYGDPLIDTITGEVKGGYLSSVTINFRTDSRIVFDSLFINNTYDSDPENWNSWNYYVIDRPNTNNDNNTEGTLASTGFYSVLEGFDPTDDYTLSKYGGRTGNPNGIDVDALQLLNRPDNEVGFAPEYFNTDGVYKLVYDFENAEIKISDGGLFIAYSPWCANDVIGGKAVPEPGTLLLFGAGLMGLGLFRRFRKN